MQLNRPFVRLPFAFDAERLAAEVAALPAHAWRPHPTGQPGNHAVPLISREGQVNDDFQGPMRPTPALSNSPYLAQAMASFGEVLGRSRLMKLDPGAEVGMHVDFNYHWHSRVRVHVPVSTNPDVTFRCGEAAVHMSAGSCWLFDNWRRHNVVNAGDTPRIHLVIDLAGSSRFWHLVRGMENLADQADPESFRRALRQVPYQPGLQVALSTEQYNTAAVMAPGEVDALVRELIEDFSAHPDNEAELVARYRTLLTDFALDWREAWHQYGPTANGLPHYRRLIEAAAAALHPDRRALVTASNDVGVNAVIMQRILRAALAPELL